MGQGFALVRIEMKFESKVLRAFSEGACGSYLSQGTIEKWRKRNSQKYQFPKLHCALNYMYCNDGAVVDKIEYCNEIHYS